MDLAMRLVNELSSEAFTPEKYTDEYQARVLEVVEAKVEGKEVTSLAPQAQRTQVIDLMDALKQSLGKRGAGAGGAAAGGGRKVTELEKKPAARARQKAEPAPREKKIQGGKR
jgi:DNA end-binding protein Ku